MIRVFALTSSRARRHVARYAALLAVALFVSTPTAIGQVSTDPSGATTISSKEKVNIILDHDRTPEKSTLLVKIMVPQDAKVNSFMLSDPPRLVVDFVGVRLKKSEEFSAPKNGVVKQIRLGAHPDKLRIVMDLIPEKAPQFEWRAGPRQATLRIDESISAPKPKADTAPAIAQAAPAAVSVTAPPVAPISKAPETPAPTKAPSTATPTAQPTSTPTPLPTKAPTVAPTATHTPLPTSSPTVAASPTPAPTRPEPKAKLPELSDRELEAALDQEVAKASAALERGEELKDSYAEGEDLVDVPSVDTGGGEGLEIEEKDESPSLAKNSAPTLQKEPTKVSGIITKDLPTAAISSPSAPPQDSLSSLRANVVPAQPVVEFTVQSAGFASLEPAHQQAFKVTLSKAGAQAQMSKVDPTTYKIIIPKCGLSNLGLALPQYPPADFNGLTVVTSRVEGDSVEITAQVEAGTTLTTLIRDREIWIKKG